MADPSDADLTKALAALASPVRLAILRELRAPRALQRIDVRVGDEADRARPLARQTIREHLDKLLEAGLAVPQEAGESARGPDYQVNHQAIFALAEEVRGLARLRPVAEQRLDTVSGPAPALPALPRHSLVVVKGIEEGRAFDVTPPPSGEARWMLGRRRGLPISLDFDPYLSGENTVVGWDGRAYYVENVPSSRNGTMVNFRPVPDGVRELLGHGDILSVGRSVLVLRA